jgi:hypothetical protein
MGSIFQSSVLLKRKNNHDAMRNILGKSLIITLFAVLLSACEKPSVIDDAELLNRLMTNSVDTLVYNSSKHVIEAELYRNFFPGSSIPTKRPLIAEVSLVNLDSVRISSNLDITKMYIIRDPLIWVSSPTYTNSQSISEYKLSKFSNDGPEWDTKILVDVVVEIRNSIKSENYLLIVKDITIERIE